MTKSRFAIRKVVMVPLMAFKHSEEHAVHEARVVKALI